MSINTEKPQVPASDSKSGPWPSRFLWLAVLIVILAVVYYFYQSAGRNLAGTGKPETPPVSIAAITSRKGDMPIYLNGLGTVTALKTVTVHSRVDGELMQVAFKEGQMVRQGDLLVEIDPRPYKAQLEQAEGQLLRDQALLKNAYIDLDRYQTLLEQDSIAAQQTATQVALVKQYQGTVEMDKGLVDSAKLQVIYAHITAPITGRIGLRLVDQGNIVHATDTNGLLVITQTQPITVIFTLPEDTVPQVIKRWRSQGSIGVEAYDRAGSRKLANGKVSAIDNQIDTTTGTLKLKAQFDNEDGVLFANQFVNIKMHLDTLHDVTLTANAAIQRGAKGTYVMVVKEDDTIAIRPVKIGAEDGETVAVLDGLAAGEKLVIDGADKLREGSKVKIVKQDDMPIKPANGAHNGEPGTQKPSHS
ncbi:MAG: MdtA/MuxA family multidrug efflux RND transporter periplasmic adaptor subunit [Methylococcales bacterium]|nr:MdtA/MuxA family multidrug efflux RND transporter periplasmic adaptor subunit [Methylococcales bacterium]